MGGPREVRGPPDGMPPPPSQMSGCATVSKGVLVVWEDDEQQGCYSEVNEICSQNDAGRSGDLRTARGESSDYDVPLAGGQRRDNLLSEGIWFTAKERAMEP